MVRMIKNKNGEFIVFNTSLEVKDKGRTIKVPLYVQVDITVLDQEENHKVFKSVSGLFNRPVTINLDKPTKNEKPWWKKLFNK
jgi:hypothetical protein|tara:strand:+ start:1581 stop:1829 length:249 start_codon:yes stop_codon:yes gene_type:complete